MELITCREESLNRNLLLCSFLTISPNIILSEELKTHLTTNEKNYPVPEYYTLEYLSLLLNKPEIRQLSYRIVKPLISRVPKTNSTSMNLQNFETDQLLIKQYLKKFNYTYKNFFNKKQSVKYKGNSEKELNSFAIKSLFLIIGI
jgi:hypothetical protein